MTLLLATRYSLLAPALSFPPMRRLIAALLFAPAIALAQYHMPPKEIADVVDAPPPPIASVSPHGKWLLLIQQPAMLTIADLSRPERKLAGIRFDPETHDQSRSLYARSLTLVRVSDGESRAIAGV